MKNSPARLLTALKLFGVVFFMLVVLGCPNPATAITFVQFTGERLAASDTTHALTFGSNITAGNLIVLAVGWSSSTVTVSSITDTLGNTYTSAVGPTVQAAIPYSAQIFYAMNSSGGANTVTVTYSATVGQRRLYMHEASGIVPSSALDVTSANTGASGDLDSLGATTTQTDELLIGWGISNNGLTGGTSGWTTHQAASDGELSEHNIVSATGTYNATFTSSGGSWIAQIATFFGVAGVERTKTGVGR